MFNTELTNQELIAEYQADFSDLTIKSLTDRESETARILPKAGDRTIVTIPSIVVADSGNRYLSLLTFRREIPDWSVDWKIELYHIGLLPTPKGTFGLLFYLDRNMTLKLSTHFLERYRERLLNLNDPALNSELSSESIIDIMEVFVRRNLNITWIETDVVFKDRTHIFAPVNDGVVLIQWNEKRQLLQANTFITYDMLDETQTRMVGYALQYLALPPEQQAQYGVPKFLK